MTPRTRTIEGDETMALVIRDLHEVEYDERTDVINPVVRHRNPHNFWMGSMRILANDVGWRVVQPLTGWEPWTHLIQYGEPDGADTWGYLLATLAEAQ